MAETIYNKYKNTYDYVLSPSNTNSLDTKNLQFLSGIQADLDKLFLDYVVPNNETDVRGTAIEGAFYLTSDTHRLYIGRKIKVDATTEKTIPIPVNEGIQTVADLATLNTVAAHAGEFYYITGSNILAIYNGSQWVQINPNTDTDTDTSVSGFSVGTGVEDYALTSDSVINTSKVYYTRSGASAPYTYAKVASPVVADIGTYYEKVITYTWTLQQTAKDVLTGNNLATQPANLTGTFNVSTATIASLVKVGVSSSAVASNSTTVSLTGENADSTQNFTITGSGGITLSGSKDDLTISSKTYGIESAAVSGATSVSTANISLVDSNSTQDSIAIKTGANLAIDNSVADEITIKHTVPGTAVTGYQLTSDRTAQSGKTYYSDASGTAVSPAPTVGADISSNGYYEEFTSFGDNTPGTVSEGASIEIPKFNVDANGHVRDVSNVSINLPSAVSIASVAADNTGKITLTKSDTNTVVSGQDLYHTITIDGASSTVYNQGSLGSFYSASKVDALIENQLKGLNALVYKGTVGAQTSTTEALPSSNVAVGDTYLVDSGVTSLDYTGDSTAESVRPGDLLIASGDEFALTSDAAISSTKTYYTRSSTTPYVYTKVTSPDVSNIGSYYENTGIIQGTITWTRVAAGDIDTQYDLTFNTAAKSFSLIDTSNSNTAKGTISFNNTDSKISIGMAAAAVNDTDNGVLTINHAESGVIADSSSSKTAGPSADATLSSGGTFTVPYITVDRTGHITAAADKTFTLPSSNNDNYSLQNYPETSGSSFTYDTTIRLLKNTSDAGSINLVGPTTPITVTAGTGTDAGKIKISHATISQTDTTPATTIADDATSVTAVTGVTRDSYGHVTGIATTTYTLPNRYSMAGSSTVTSSGGYKSVTNTLYQGSTARGTVSYKSSTLDIATVQTGSAGNYNTTYTVELKWGSF